MAPAIAPHDAFVDAFAVLVCARASLDEDDFLKSRWSGSDVHLDAARNGDAVLRSEKPNPFRESRAAEGRESRCRHPAPPRARPARRRSERPNVRSTPPRDRPTTRVRGGVGCRVPADLEERRVTEENTRRTSSARVRRRRRRESPPKRFAEDDSRVAPCASGVHGRVGRAPPACIHARASRGTATRRRRRRRCRARANPRKATRATRTPRASILDPIATPESRTSRRWNAESRLDVVRGEDDAQRARPAENHHRLVREWVRRRRGRDVGSSRGSRTTASAARWQLAKAAYDAPEMFFQLFVDAFVSNARDTAAAAPTSRTSSRRRPNGRVVVSLSGRAHSSSIDDDVDDGDVFQLGRERSRASSEFRRHRHSKNKSHARRRARSTPATAHETFPRRVSRRRSQRTTARVSRSSVSDGAPCFAASFGRARNVVAASIGSALADVASENV